MNVLRFCLVVYLVTFASNGIARANGPMAAARNAA